MIRHQTRAASPAVLFAFLTAVTLAMFSGSLAQAQTTSPKVFYACYVPASGTVYRIREADTKQQCASERHVEFSWTSGSTSAGVTDHGALQGLGDDDHPQYLLVDGSRALTGALSAGGQKLTNLAAATANGEAVRYEQAVKSGDAAGGDLSGTYPAPTVAKLQNTNVSSTAPASGEVLAFDGSAWKPTAATSAGNGISGWERVSNSFNVLAGDFKVLIASCPTGKKATGGGYKSDFGKSADWSFPNADGQGWTILVENFAGPADIGITVYAVCANAAA